MKLDDQYRQQLLALMEEAIGPMERERHRVTLAAAALQGMIARSVGSRVTSDELALAAQVFADATLEALER